MASKLLRFFAIVLMAGLSPAAFGQQQADVKTAMSLFNSHQYARSAAAFERIIQTRPDRSSCYYAALANRAAGKRLRAQQLFNYIVATFPNSTEAKYAKQALAQGAAVPAAVASTSGAAALPKSILDALPPNVRAVLDTPEGKAKLDGILQQQAGNLATVREAEQKGMLKNKPAIPSYASAAMNLGIGKHKDGDFVFTAADIARDGAGGIDQTRYPNCWFEASMSALAELPRGQRLLASMIKYRDPDKYVVRFPGDGVEYVITPEDLQRATIHDKALWASLIEAAEIRKFPTDRGGYLPIGLGCLAGCKAEVKTPNACSKQELSSFIGGAVTAQNPIVAATYPSLANLPPLAIPQHAYTIIGFDAAKDMIVMRNPHGSRSHRFALANDPHHEKFEQLDDGKFRISIGLFQVYFDEVCRASI